MPGSFRRHDRFHFRWHSARRRILFDTHDIRLGLFYVTGEHGSAYLHLPFVVIMLRG